MGGKPMMKSCQLGQACDYFVPALSCHGLSSIPIRLGAEEKAASDFLLSTLMQILPQQLACYLSIHHDAPAAILGNFWTNGNLLMRKREVAHLQGHQFTSALGPIVGKYEHEAVAQRLWSGDVQQTIPLIITGQPGEVLVMP